MQDKMQEIRQLGEAGSETTLVRCLFDGDSETRSRARLSRGKSFGASLAIELLMLGLLIAAPLFSSVARPQLHQALPPQLAFFAGGRPHNLVQQAAPNTKSRQPTITETFSEPQLAGVTVRPLPPEEPGNGPIPDVPEGYVPGIVPSMGPGLTPPPEPPKIASPPRQEKRPLKLSEGVVAAQLISRVEPPYPPLARETRVQGEVRLHAIISRDGSITSLDVISGHPLLVRAALDAVRQWRYRPTMLNGEPVEVETFITVVFQLNR